MRTKLWSFFIPLAICSLFLGANVARADDDNSDENVANGLNLEDQASDLLISPAVDCYLFPDDPTCILPVDIGFYPSFNWDWYGGGRRHHHRHHGHHGHHGHHRR